MGGPVPGKPRILCVDDQQQNLAIRAMLLQQFGCDTITVTDHSSALRALTENHVDLLLIDYHLAGNATGEEIARDVRALQPDIPLVMLTGDARLPDSAAESVDAILVKGQSNPRDLLETIQRLLPQASLKPMRPMLIPEKPTKAS